MKEDGGSIEKKSFRGGRQMPRLMSQRAGYTNFLAWEARRIEKYR
jgi:hypothetical protein